MSSIPLKYSTIQPKGRLSYGHYMAAGNITSTVVKSTYYGNDSTTSIGEDTGGGNQDDRTGFYMFLSKESCAFDAQKLAISAQTDTIQVIGYKENQRVPTYVMALDEVDVEYDDTTGEARLIPPANNGITGIPNTGLTVTISNNGTTATTITVTVDSTIQGEGGSLYFPCNIYLSTMSEMGPEVEKWYPRASDCERIDFEYSYTIERGSPSSSYSLQLTNDSAGINCDINGNVLSGATRPQCTAELYFGIEKISSGVTYDIATPQAANARGIAVHHTNGKLLYDGEAEQGQLFSFEGTALDVTFSATYSGLTFTKIMTITKQYPGVDGTGATTRWIVPSVSVIKVDPNTGTITPQTVTAKVMKQVNDLPPEEDASTTMYWGWDTETPRTAYTGAITVVASGHDNLVLGLKNSGGTFYELETIPLLEEGTNGTSGSSVYRLDLTNENASINCDSGGTLLPGAVRPSCKATLYYGQDEVSDAYYYFGQNYGNGISISASTGDITVSNSFTWTGTSIGIEVRAKSGGSEGLPRGTAIFTLSKNFPGANGEPAVSYWLTPSASVIRVDASGNTYPSTITCEAYKQVGENEPEQIGYSEEPYIYWGFNTLSPADHYTGQTITVSGSQNYVAFQLWDDDIQYDFETIPILHDGTNGQGRNGAAILGPTEWTSATERRWHSGNDNVVPGDEPTEEDEMFLDIIVRVSGGTNYYYYCNTSYTQHANTSWDSVSQYWTQADEQFEFVAAKLILASGASIDFMTGNEIYLRDSGGTVTAGAAGGNGISFWAGSNTPGNAPFRVNYDGSMTATKGTFGCLEIGENTNFGSVLEGDFDDGDGITKDININPSFIQLTSTSGGTEQESVIIAPAANTDKLDAMGTITVMGNSGSTALYTNEKVVAGSLDVIKTKAPKDGSSSAGSAIIGAGLFNLEVVMQTSGTTWSDYFTKDGPNSTWRFKGVNTNVSYVQYPNVAVQTSVEGDDALIRLGYWAFYYTSSGAKLFSGIAGPNIQKQQGIIYIQI